MDYRCPDCGTNLRRRGWTDAVVARMEVECSHCRNVIRLNIHPAEVTLVLLIFGTIVVLAAFGYWFQSRGLMLAVFGAAMAGALALPLLERVYLRSWPRYAPTGKGPGS
jgi:DNA-directed RNA polymerase subunit RPC12/RpoP